MTERTPGHPDTGQGGYLSGQPGERETTAHPARTPDTRQRTGEPLLASLSSWAVLVSGFGLSASTWIALAVLAGFTGQVSIPTVSGWLITFHLAWLMPIAIDGYVVTALVLWMAPVPAKVAGFARRNTYAGALIGVVAQSAYHALSTWSVTGIAWRAALACIIGALPPAVCAVAVHMRALIRREAGQVSVIPARRTSAFRAPRAATPAVPATRPVSTGQVPAIADSPADTVADTDNGRAPDRSNVMPLAGRTRRTGQAPGTSVEALADTLGAAFPSRTVGQPAALAELRRVHGSCSKDRAIAAKNLHNSRVGGQVDGSSGTVREPSDDSERVLVGATA